MRTMSFLFGSMVAVAAASAMAETTVSDVTVRQNWPWSGDVDIAFTLGGEKSDVTVSATWDGQSEPVVLDADLSVNLADLLPGKYTVRWTPPANTALPGFRVNVSPVGFDARKYLVADLKTGAYEFLAEPDANWDDNAYRTTKMIFARIPAGTYTLGLSDDQLKTVFPDNSKPTPNTPATRQGLRTVRITHDYYMGSFLVSNGQMASITNGPNTSGKGVAAASHVMLRGAAPNANWPSLGHTVTADSIVGQLRNRIRLPHGWIADLTSSAQWEVAARCGTTSLFADETLTADSSLEDYTNYLNRVAWWQGMPGKPISIYTVPVGSLESNQWGVRDTVGYRMEQVADWYFKEGDFGSWAKQMANEYHPVENDVFIDPVGPITANNREYRSVGFGNTTTIGTMLATRINYKSVTTSSDMSFRFCIYTHSLFGE